jgi:hypothetical protein
MTGYLVTVVVSRREEAASIPVPAIWIAAVPTTPGDCGFWNPIDLPTTADGA